MHDGHRKRMKERYKNDGGFENFAQHEILEMLLYSTIARGDTNPIAHELIQTFGSIANVFEADPEELKKVHGIGESSAYLLSMIPHLSKVYNETKWNRKIMLGTSDLVGQYAINLFIGKTYEEFRIICLDSNRQVFYQGVVTKGTIDEVPTYPRLIVEEVLKHNAKTVIFAHNHPGGSVFPSESDIHATNKLIDALNAIDVCVLDHVIVSGNRYYSMSDKGRI